MADFTALKTAIQNAIKQNGNEEITGNILQDVLLAIVTTLGDGSINDLITALGSEATTRGNADTTLQQNINAEAQARGNADTALGGRIDDEATARANGDTALANRLGSSITAENTAADQIGAEAEARAAADTALQGLIDGITENIENGYVYAGIATPSSTPTTGKVFYLALTAGTYTNFGNIAVTQGINILKYNGSTWSVEQVWGVDDEPTEGSNNLVKSGGVKNKLLPTITGGGYGLTGGNLANDLTPDPSFNDRLYTTDFININSEPTVSTRWTGTGYSVGYVIRYANADGVGQGTTYTSQCVKMKIVFLVNALGTQPAFDYHTMMADAHQYIELTVNGDVVDLSDKKKALSTEDIFDSNLNKSQNKINAEVVPACSTIVPLASVINVDAIAPLSTGYYTEEEARQAVPAKYKKLGAIITFKLKSNFPVMEQFIGSSLSQWNNQSYWTRLNKSFDDLMFTGGFIDISLSSYNSETHIATYSIKVRRNCTAQKSSHTSYTSEIYELTIPTGEYQVSANLNEDATSLVGLWWNTNGTGSFELGRTPSHFTNCYLVFPVLYLRDSYIHPYQAPIGDIALRFKLGNDWLYVEPRPLVPMGKLLVSNVIPTDEDDYDLHYLIKNMFAGYYELVFPEGEFAVSNFPGSTTLGKRKITGQGIDKTIFKSSTGATVNSSAHHDVDLEGMTLQDIMFKDGERNTEDKKNKSDTFSNLKFLYTITNQYYGYAIYELCDTYSLHLHDCIFEVNDGISFPVGVSINAQSIVDIQNCTFKGLHANGIRLESVSGGLVKGCKVYGTTSAIHNSSSKSSPTEHLTIEDCYVENAEEESISFDSYGNNVDLCPLIAELAINDGEQLIESISEIYFHFKLKLYCEARNVIGSHPNESFAPYSFIGNEEYIKKFYLVFHTNSGTDFAGTVAKILDVGYDETKGNYVVIGCDKPFENFDGLNDYKAASILSGFHYLTVRNNIIRNGNNAGIALYGTCFNSVIENNIVENCKGDGTFPKTERQIENPFRYGRSGACYIYSMRGLGLSVIFPSYNITIKNNHFIGALYFPFTLRGGIYYEFDDTIAYGCIFDGNVISGGLGPMITGQRNFIYGNNIICGEGTKLYLGNVETKQFGRTLPENPTMGDVFQLMEEDFDSLNLWKGDKVVSVKRFNGTTWDTIY